MNLLSVISIVLIGLLGLFIGIYIGIILGRVGSIHFLAFVIRIPAMLFKAPDKIKKKWNMCRELKDQRKVERLKKYNLIKALNEKIETHLVEIKELKKQRNKIKWN